MKSILATICLICFVSIAFAQEQNPKKSKRDLRKERIDNLIKQEEEGIIAYRKSFAVGGKLTTDGYGGFIEIGRAKSVDKGLLFQLEITEKKHNKEEKQQRAYMVGSPMIFGKMNYFYPVKFGVQQWMNLGNKGNKNGVSVTAQLGGGLSLGLLRPYNIKVKTASGEDKYVSYYTDSTAFMDVANYVSGPSFGTGWNGITVNPGAYIKPAIRFDYGRYNEIISALEVGLTGEFYSKKVDQMVFMKKRQFFFGAYVALLMGNRK